MNRPALFTALIGRPGTGKTTKLGAIINNRVDLGDRAIIIDQNADNEAFFRYPEAPDINSIPSNFKGGVVVTYEESTKDEPGTFAQLWERISNKELKNFNLVLDDANTYSEGRPERELRKLITRARNSGIDIWTTAHGLSDIPNFFQKYVSLYGILPVLNFSPERSRMTSYNEIVQVMKRVNQTAAATGNKYHIEYCTNFGEPVK